MALEDEGFFVEKDNIKINDEYKSGYYVKGLKILDNLDNLDNGSTQPRGGMYGVEVLSKLSKTSKENILEEFISDNEEIIHHKCSICGDTPCITYSDVGKPICKDCLQYKKK
jgi:hypothetical protein